MIWIYYLMKAKIGWNSDVSIFKEKLSHLNLFPIIHLVCVAYLSYLCDEIANFLAFYLLN